MTLAEERLKVWIWVLFSVFLLFFRASFLLFECIFYTPCKMCR